MNYPEALQYIHSAPRFKGTAGLARIRRLCTLLGEPQRGMRFVHIAGTNGKGSIAHMTAAALTASGYRTGLFISPFVVDFRERMQVDGRLIPRETLADVASRVRAAAERLAGEGMDATEFELVTACGLLWFREAACDFVVLEVGLGGRFDATNVIDAPECAVIARIALDHTAILGDTVEQIAMEKCGIIKGACEVVSVPGQAPGALEVIRQTCRRTGARLTVPELPEAEAVTLESCRFHVEGLEWSVPLGGAHQLTNAAAALAVLEALRRRGVCIPPERAAAGIAALRFPGRLERAAENPLIYLDGAHNPDGASALAGALAGTPHTVVFAAMRDKDYAVCARTLAASASRFIVCGLPMERAASPEEILRSLEGVPAEAVPDAAGALRLVQEAGETAVFCGSLYLVAEARALLRGFDAE